MFSHQTEIRFKRVLILIFRLLVFLIKCRIFAFCIETMKLSMDYEHAARMPILILI